MILTKDQVLTKPILKTRHVKVFGGEMIVSQITEFEQGKLESALVGRKSGMNLSEMKVKYVIATCVNEDGSKFFDDKDKAKIGKLAAADINKIFEAAEQLNVTVSDDFVEETAKN